MMQPIRGNVPTRLQKIAGGQFYAATILAAAGLLRLGHDLSTGVLEINGEELFVESLDWMLPAPGQGAIAVETRSNNRAVALLSALHDGTTARCVEAERLVLKHLGGGCHLALGALATEAEGVITLRAVFVPDEKALPRTAIASASHHEEVAHLVAEQLLVP